MAKPVSAAIVRQTENRYYRAGFLRAPIGFFANYVNFTGRSSRSEYWWVALWRLILVSLMIAGVAAILVVGDGIKQLYAGDGSRIVALLLLIFFFILVGLAMFVPSLALEVRRYRDAGWSWWWMVGFYGTSGVGGILYSSGTLNYEPGLVALGMALVLATAVFELVIDLLPTKNPPQDDAPNDYPAGN